MKPLSLLFLLCCCGLVVAKLIVVGPLHPACSCVDTHGKGIPDCFIDPEICGIQHFGWSESIRGEAERREKANWFANHKKHDYKTYDREHMVDYLRSEHCLGRGYGWELVCCLQNDSKLTGDCQTALFDDNKDVVQPRYLCQYSDIINEDGSPTYSDGPRCCRALDGPVYLRPGQSPEDLTMWMDWTPSKRREYAWEMECVPPGESWRTWLTDYKSDPYDGSELDPKDGEPGLEDGEPGLEDGELGLEDGELGLEDGPQSAT